MILFQGRVHPPPLFPLLLPAFLLFPPAPFFALLLYLLLLLLALLSALLSPLLLSSPSPEICIHLLSKHHQSSHCSPNPPHRAGPRSRHQPPHSSDLHPSHPHITYVSLQHLCTLNPCCTPHLPCGRYLDGKAQLLYPEPEDVFPCDLIHQDGCKVSPFDPDEV